ncbi:MAG TPA: hypothetical protein VH301_12915 [Usitatibacter sp.]|nr:hypothetical protein [Usitatibacter sp.]
MKLVLGVAVVWLALAPPLFTDGACTAEYQAENARLEAGRDSIGTSVAADGWYSSRGVPHAVLSVDECRHRKPRNLPGCGEGITLVAKVPVTNLVCRIYRDDEIAVTLQYDARDRLARRYVEMNPFKSLPLPWGGALHWAR